MPNRSGWAVLALFAACLALSAFAGHDLQVVGFCGAVAIGLLAAGRGVGTNRGGYSTIWRKQEIAEEDAAAHRPPPLTDAAPYDEAAWHAERARRRRLGE